MCRSVPHTEATRTFTRTSSGPYSGMGTWRTSAPGADSGFTTASMVSGIRFPVRQTYEGQTNYSNKPGENQFHRKGREGRKGKHKKNNDGQNRRSRLFFCLSFAPFAVATAFRVLVLYQRAYNLTNRLIK